MTPRVTHRTLLAVVGLLAAVAVVGMVALWPGERPPEPAAAGSQTTALRDATILDVDPLPVDEELIGFTEDAVEVRVTARLDDTGEVVVFTNLDDTGDLFHAGQRVRLSEIVTEGQPVTYAISDFRRGRPLAVLTALFVVAVVGFGRFQGLRALLGLGLTALVIIGFLVPAVLDDRNPVLVALTAALAIMLVTLYLSHGPSPKTTAAVVGTALALVLTGTLAAGFAAAANLTGFSSEEARLVYLEAGGLSLRGLLLAGIVLGGLGVLDDVTVSQSSTVFELHRADPDAGFGALVRGALTVGRDHVAATVNTLFLAYAGAALPLLILFVTGVDPFTTVVTSEVVAVEVVRTLVGSLGLIAAVPLTTVLAAGLALGEPGRPTAQDATPGQGHRSSSRSAWPEERDDDWVERLRGAYGIHRESGGPSGPRGGER